MTDAVDILIAEAFATTPDALPADAMIGEIAGWDSLGHMRLMLAIETQIERRLTPVEITHFTSLSAIRAFLAD